MAPLKSCCFLSIRNGSYVSAVYTLIFYTLLVTTGTIHIHNVSSDAGLYVLTVSLVISSAIAITSSILLIIGISGENSSLLIPWMIAILLVTVLEVFIIGYVLYDAEMEPFLVVLIIFDLLICFANIYCFLCVVSYFAKIRKNNVDDLQYKSQSFYDSCKNENCEVNLDSTVNEKGNSFVCKDEENGNQSFCLTVKKESIPEADVEDCNLQSRLNKSEITIL